MVTSASSQKLTLPASLKARLHFLLNGSILMSEAEMSNGFAVSETERDSAEFMEIV